MKYDHVFHNQTFNTFFNYGCRGSISLLQSGKIKPGSAKIAGTASVNPLTASSFPTRPTFASRIRHMPTL